MQNLSKNIGKGEFWQTIIGKCKFCQRIVEKEQEFRQKIAEKMQILSINTGKNAKSVKKILRKTGILTNNFWKM